MTTRLNIDDLTRLVTRHAMRIGQKSNASARDKCLVSPVLGVLDAIEMRAWGRPEIAAVVHSVRKSLNVQSE
jgi:hypothetical protein